MQANCSETRPTKRQPALKGRNPLMRFRAPAPVREAPIRFDIWAATQHRPTDWEGFSNTKDAKRSGSSWGRRTPARSSSSAAQPRPSIWSRRPLAGSSTDHRHLTSGPVNAYLPIRDQEEAAGPSLLLLGLEYLRQVLVQSLIEPFRRFGMSRVQPRPPEGATLAGDLPNRSPTPSSSQIQLSMLPPAPMILPFHHFAMK